MDVFAIYLMNFIVMLSMLLATLYRAWIEKQNLDARRKLEKLAVVLKQEEKTIQNMTGNDFIEMLRVILNEN